LVVSKNPTAGQLLRLPSVWAGTPLRIGRPVVDDPGDHYDFAANHLFLAGIQF
jgi:hypothetical protein